MLFIMLHFTVLFKTFTKFKMHSWIQFNSWKSHAVLLFVYCLYFEFCCFLLLTSFRKTLKMREEETRFYRSDGSSKMPPRQKHRWEWRSGVRRGVKRNGERNPLGSARGRKFLFLVLSKLKNTQSRRPVRLKNWDTRISLPPLWYRLPIFI